ncbi:hypothetical protein MINTM002_29230 [Mycobacterium intracellulare]|nr:hypothetical protein MINTM002_29230 [Mycobacterium intracellulare]BCP26665.1 hypothetical protein MINTM025_30210 [Mycobacterium intracellulare]
MIITRPGAQRSTSSAGQASPATTSATDSRPAGESAPAADGVWLSTLTRSATSSACRSSGERATDSGTTTSRPPCNRAPKISQTDTSKASECHCDHTPVRGNPESFEASSWVTLRCVTATPLGTPVVPEV